jgi:hypothetical protein
MIPNSTSNKYSWYRLTFLCSQSRLPEGTGPYLESSGIRRGQLAHYKYGLSLGGQKNYAAFLYWHSRTLLGIFKWEAIAMGIEPLQWLFNGVFKRQFYVNGALVSTLLLSAGITARGNSITLAPTRTGQFLQRPNG